MVSGYLVLFKGMSPEEAIQAFEAVRGCGPESEEQLMFLDLLHLMRRRMGPWDVIRELAESLGIGDLMGRA